MPRRPAPKLPAPVAACIASLPEKGSFPTEKREAWIAYLRCAFDVAYGVVERPAATTNIPGNIPAATNPSGNPAAPRLYVIMQDGQARCDGQPMALKELPAVCTFIDKRGPIADAQFAWESIMWSEGAVKPGTPMPAGLTLMPKTPGPKLRAVGSDEGAEAMT